MRLAASLFLAGCFSPTIAPGSLRCDTSGLCPPGLSCVAGVCGGTIPTGDGGVPMDLSGAPTYAGGGELGALDLTGQSGVLLCNTESGAMQLGSTTVVAAGAKGFSHQAQTSGPPLAVWSFDELVVPSAVTVRPASASVSVPVFLGKTSLDIEGQVDWRGYGGYGGQANVTGGVRGAPTSLAGGGAAMATGGGGGGAGYGTAGMAGNGPGAGSAGTTYGDPSVQRFYFGSGGGGGGGTGAGLGGSGGGAVVLLGASITIGNSILVSGDDGVSPTSSELSGGGGGGSGGTIVIGGDVVAFTGAQYLEALGGHGADGVDGASGDGGLIAGGMGGGGAVGRIRISGKMVAGTPHTNPSVTVDNHLLVALPN